MATKVFFETYGCTFNAADTDAFVAAVKKAGMEIAKSEGEADVIILNTCSVKDSTQSKILHRLRALSAKGVKIVVAGCLAQAATAQVRKAAPNAAILGTYASADIADAIKAAEKGGEFTRVKKTADLPFNVEVDGVFARVQISKGCLNNCSYCSTKLARGGLSSYPPEEIVAGVESAVLRGAKEIQLTAQDTACYGFDLEPKTDLAALLKRVCAIDGRFRVRIGMGCPENFAKIREPLADAMKDGKVYSFLHLPIQSGSDRVLAAMNRKYTAKEYAELVVFFRREIPPVTIENDIIVGFPGETEGEFERTVESVKSTRPEITNVSKYSARPNTPAAALPQLDRGTVNKRSEIASKLCRRITLEENGRMVGRECEVLVTEDKGKCCLGRAQNYKPVLVEKCGLGKFVKAKIRGFGQSYLQS